MIKKRNGDVVDYKSEKVISAVSAALVEVNDVVNTAIAHEIDQAVKTAVSESKEDVVTIDFISDLIEDMLFDLGEVKAGKAFVRYRAEQDFMRKHGLKDKKKFKIFRDEFISRYKHLPDPMEQLGSFVYYRTYSRWLKDEKRRERWWETVARAVEYNIGLSPIVDRKEAEELFENIYHLRQFLSGRTFWVGGTDVAKYYPMANYNCSFEILEDIESFSDLFYLLMIGSGVGARVLKDDVQKIPKLRTDLELVQLNYDPVKPYLRKDSSELTFDRDVAEITVGDSKEGWVQALDYYLKLLSSKEYRKVKFIKMNYDNVRPYGEKLKTFGGRASGHTSLLGMFDKINNLITSKRDQGQYIKLEPIDCLDIANMIGENVVVGGVRRTAEIILIDADDEKCIKAKNNLYKNNNGNWEIDESIAHRAMSNNSIFYKNRPTRKMLHWQIEQMRYSGEPAWVNGVAAGKRRTNANGVNP